MVLLEWTLIVYVYVMLVRIVSIDLGSCTTIYGAVTHDGLIELLVRLKLSLEFIVLYGKTSTQALWLLIMIVTLRRQGNHLFSTT